VAAVCQRRAFASHRPTLQDVAPTELLFVFELLICKDASPTGFEKLNPCFIRVHPWLKIFRAVRVVRGQKLLDSVWKWAYQIIN